MLVINYTYLKKDFLIDLLLIRLYIGAVEERENE